MPKRKFGRRRWRLSAAGALLGAFLGAGAASAQRVEAGQAPAAWIAYAQSVSSVVQSRLEGDEPRALRLRAYLQQVPGAATDEGSVIKVAFWIDASGKITRIEHALFAQSQPNDDLQALLVGQVLPQAPPRGMLLPLRLSVRIKPGPQDAAPQPALMTRP